MSQTTEERVFAEGIRTFNKRDSQPDFVIGSVILEPNKLYKWLKQNSDLLEKYEGEPQLKMQAVYSKEGKFIIKIDHWKPDPNYTGTTTTNTAATNPEEDSDDLPF